jgi:predicted 2-oxoglutarate/Fe(II)-dependent dioxygenase YbiX
MPFSSTSMMHDILAHDQALNQAGRDRCAFGILNKTENTLEATPELYGALDYIVVDDFLNRDECEILMAAQRALRQTLPQFDQQRDYWNGRVLYAHEVGAHNAAAGEIMIRFQKEATRRLQEFYQLTEPVYADTVQLVFWNDGMFMPPHADNANPDGSAHGMAWRNFSSVVYLNDDYDGGELYFTALDQYIKPKAGMLVGFTGGFHHEHSVLKVTGGDRFTMPSFYTFDASKADRFIYPELFEDA